MICLVWKGESSLSAFTFSFLSLLLIAIVMFMFAVLLVCIFAMSLFASLGSSRS